ncbi:Protein FAR1-RELATED SEQUENCE 5 [Linum grandiflorum]
MTLGVVKSDKAVKDPLAKTKSIRKKPETRIGCKARIRFQLNETLDLYYISAWVGEHNHVWNPKEFVHLLISNMRVSPANGMLMEIKAATGISLRPTFEIISATTGGVENVGCTKVDHRNHLARIRQRQIIRGEATAITEYFQDKSRLCPGFWYEMEVDAEENIANIFWASQRIRDDYACFDDSITFDNTFRTNKHYRPLCNVLHYHISYR